ncbi:MAG TPA: AI-2E family transporter [Myxococcales bacterium]|nr:AI-2E family transporter [Myxococcales bacterium]
MAVPPPTNSKSTIFGGPPDDWNAYRRYLYLLAKLLFFSTLAYLGFLLIRQAGGLIFMLFISLLAAYILDPLVDWFERRGINRSVGILILVTISVSAAGSFLLWIVPTLISEFADAGARIQQWLDKDPSQFIAWLGETLGIEISPELMTEIKLKAREIAPQVISALSELLQSALARSMEVVGWALNIIMVPVFIFYFLRDFDHMKAWVGEQLPLKGRDFIIERAHRVDRVVGDWLRGQVQVALILAVLYGVGLGLTGIRLGGPIGIMTGLLCVVPFLGFAIGLSLTLLMVILDWQGGGMLLGVTGVFVTNQLIEGYLLTPRIVGEKVGLSPVAILIALLLGGEMFGFLGFLLAVPVAGASKTIGIEIIDWYRQSHYYTGEEQSEERIIVVSEGGPPTNPEKDE